ncbi:MAG: LptF/LptG family permease [Bacteroidales bacterium]|nr:LptF/LptG family permease [Bacteroidales bacterium]MCR4858887.1 LptF/LptG family permease [Bacteroidales bacterium]
MKIINRYLCKNFLGPFVLTFFVALFVLLMQFLWKWVDELVGKGLELTVLLKLMFYASITLTSMAFPLAVLLASLMTFGNMGERYEIVALKSAGVSVQKMMAPLAILSIVIAAIAFEFSNEVIPKATVKLRMLLFDIQEQKPALNIEEGVFYTGFDNYAIRVGKKMPDGETVKDVMIYDHSRRMGNTSVTYAKRGTMRVTPDKQYLVFTLYDGSFWDESPFARGGNGGRYPLTRATFDKQYKRFDMSAFSLGETDENFYEGHSTALSISELNERIDTLKKELTKLAHGASDVFFGNLYYFNIFIKNDSTRFDTMTRAQRCDLADVPEDQAFKIFSYADNASRSFIYSVRFSYQDMEFRNRYLWSFQIEFFRKFTLSLACVLFFFIGAPLGSIIRKGGIGIPLVVTVVFFTLYFALSITGEKIAKSSVWPVWFGMGLSSFILLPICIFLTRHATTDSAVLSPDTYAKIVENIKKFKLFGRKKRHEDTATLS